MIGMLKKASDGCFVVAKWIVLVYMFSVTVLAIVGILFRSIGQSLSWNEELMRWLLVSLGYVGASVGIRTRNHIGIEFFLTKMNTRFRKGCVLVGYFAVMFFLLLVVWYGFEAALNARMQYGAILKLPMIWVKMNIPLGSLFMLIHLSYFTVGLFKEKEDIRKYLVSGGIEGEINL